MTLAAQGRSCKRQTTSPKMPGLPTRVRLENRAAQSSKGEAQIKGMRSSGNDGSVHIQIHINFDKQAQTARPNECYAYFI